MRLLIYREWEKNEILEKDLKLRSSLKPYIKEQMKTSETKMLFLGQEVSAQDDRIAELDRLKEKYVSDDDF